MNQSENCFNFTEKEVVVAVATRATISSLAFVACAVVILLIITFKGYRQFMYRLIVYFMVSDLLQALAQVLVNAPVSYNKEQGIASIREGWTTSCAVFGFMDQVSLWISNCVVIWIMLYLSSRVYHLRNEVTTDSDTNTSAVIGCRKEAAGILLVIVVPFTFNWVPFIWNMYGLSGLFCWIKQVDNDDCSNQTMSLILTFSMCDGPILIILLCEFVCCLTITVVLCKKSYSAQADERVKERFKTAKREMIFVFILPLVYCSLFTLGMADRLYSITPGHSHTNPLFSLSIVHDIVSPARLLVTPIAFLCHPFVWLTLFCHRKKSDMYYVVPPELDDVEEPLIIRGNLTYGSDSSQSSIEGLLPKRTPY